jgi:O-methyltransferase
MSGLNRLHSRLYAAAKYCLASIIYRHPPIGLNPSELGIYLHELLNHGSVPGDIAEIGTHLGGTACVASALVKKYTPHKSYTCFDTFEGFTESDFKTDLDLGTPGRVQMMFSNTSLALVRRILDLHGCKEVRLVKGDIATVPDESFSDRYSVILLDVDLSEPTYVGLKRLHPRLSDGGIILVDDCRQDPGQIFQAMVGYQRFCKENDLVPRIHYGFGIIEK